MAWELVKSTIVVFWPSWYCPLYYVRLKRFMDLPTGCLASSKLGLHVYSLTGLARTPIILPFQHSGSYSRKGVP
jgi:hypothetical protein